MRRVGINLILLYYFTNMSLALGFVFHLIGDYLTQNDWMANQKTKNSWVALLHATIYSLPFLYLVPNLYWLIIIVSHFFVDRFRLAVYWIKLVNWNWKSNNFGYDDNKPQWMSVWLMIIIDNVIHVCFNTFAILIQ